MSTSRVLASDSYKNKHIPELDGIRGLAIIMVILYHYVAVPIPPDASPILLWIRMILSNFWSGVDLFFVLSGFLIAGILINNRNAKNYFKVFYIRRINRIFPLYYFLLLLFLLLQWSQRQSGLFNASLFTNSLPMAPYFLFLQNFMMTFRGNFGNEFLAMTWSLAVEEQFYLFLPFLVRVSFPQRLPINILFFIGLPLILRATIGEGGYYGYVLTPWRLDALMLGAFLAIVIRTPHLFELLRRRIRWIKLFFLLLLLFLVYSSFTEELGSPDHLFIFAIFYAILIFLPLANESGFLASSFRQPVLLTLGRISYGIYLFHQLVNGIMHDLIFTSLPLFHDMPTALVTFLAFLGTCLLAFGTYYIFEKRFIAFGHKFAYCE